MGAITSTVSPSANSVVAQVENRPPGMRLTPTVTRLPPGAVQIEYERRTSSPSMTARSTRCWPGKWVNVGRSGSGTSNVRLTDSSVWGRTVTARGWNSMAISAAL